MRQAEGPSISMRWPPRNGGLPRSRSGSPRSATRRELMSSGSPGHRDLAAELAARPMTLVRDPSGLLPVRWSTFGRVLAVMTRTHAGGVRARGPSGGRAAPQELVRAGVVRRPSPARRRVRAGRPPLTAHHAAVVPGDLDAMSVCIRGGQFPGRATGGAALRSWVDRRRGREGRVRLLQQRPSGLRGGERRGRSNGCWSAAGSDPGAQAARPNELSPNY